LVRFVEFLACSCCCVFLLLLLSLLLLLDDDNGGGGGTILAAFRNKCQQAARCPPLITSHQ
jgi:hypothetical protein